MAIIYEVRIWCVTEDLPKRTTQSTLDTTWKPESCATHTTKDFVIESEYDDGT
jgi:hypothetical protein